MLRRLILVHFSNYVLTGDDALGGRTRPCGWRFGGGEYDCSSDSAFGATESAGMLDSTHPGLALFDGADSELLLFYRSLATNFGHGKFNVTGARER